MIVYQRKVHVYETDLMGIVHHSNYLRYCEEARVNWATEKKIFNSEKQDVFGLTVLDTRVRHVYPARYGDLIHIEVQVKVEGVRLFFQYRLCLDFTNIKTFKKEKKVICFAETIHCSLDLNFKVKRLDKELVKTVNYINESSEGEKWIETWL